MDLDFSKQNDMTSDIAEVQPARDVFRDCWELLERFYQIDYDSETSWNNVIDQSETIYQAAKSGSDPELDREILRTVVDTMEFIEAVSKHRKAIAELRGSGA